jgi:flagellar basal body-associated protein FliL
MIAIIVLILVLIGGAGYLYMRSQKKTTAPPVSIQTTEINNGQY